MTKDEAEGDDQCDAMELMTDNEGDFVAVANHDNNHDKASDSQISHINNKIISNKGEEEPEIEAPSDDRKIMRTMVQNDTGYIMRNSQIISSNQTLENEIRNMTYTNTMQGQ